MTGSTSLADYVSQQYMPWIKENKAPSTVRGSIQIWAAYIEPRFGKISLVDLRTEKITELLDSMAKQGFGTRTLSHTKWLLSGVYEYAINRGVVHNNPVTKAKWLVKAKRPKAKIEYSLTQVLDMLRVLEPVDLRATVAVALCYFTSCRPSEARGLRWEDWRGDQLDIKRAVWRTHVGDTKTEGSAATVPVIEPLKSLLAPLRAQQLNPSSGYMLRNYAGKSLNLDSLNVRIIAPTLKKAGIAWAGYYPCRRGISSLVTDLSKNPLNSTGLLRHSTPVTALQHYTRPQAESIRAAMEQVEELATRKPDETVQ